MDANLETLKQTEAAPNKNGYVKVCDVETGFCTLVFKDDASKIAKDGSCSFSTIELLDEKTGKIVEHQAYVCDLTPETKRICDPETGVCKIVATSEFEKNLVSENSDLSDVLPQTEEEEKVKLLKQPTPPS